MKLKELLNDLYETNCFCKNIIDNNVLLSIKEKLLSTDEFKNVKEFEILTEPIDLSTLGTIMLTDDYTFSENVCLYSVSTIKQYPLTSLYEPVKDGACITPVFYDKGSYRSITITYSPECAFDADQEKLKEDLITKFKNVLENPKDYEAKGEVVFLLRGIFQ